MSRLSSLEGNWDRDVPGRSHKLDVDRESEYSVVQSTYKNFPYLFTDENVNIVKHRCLKILVPLSVYQNHNFLYSSDSHGVVVGIRSGGGILVTLVVTRGNTNIT